MKIEAQQVNVLLAIAAPQYDNSSVSRTRGGYVLVHVRRTAAVVEILKTAFRLFTYPIRVLFMWRRHGNAASQRQDTPAILPCHQNAIAERALRTTFWSTLALSQRNGFVLELTTHVLNDKCIAQASD